MSLCYQCVLSYDHLLFLDICRMRNPTQSVKMTTDIQKKLRTKKIGHGT